MELTEAIRRRRMVRSFAPDPVDPDLVDRLLDDALRGPSAGNTRGVAWVVLQGGDTATYWEHATTADWRSSARRYPGAVPGARSSRCPCAPRPPTSTGTARPTSGTRASARPTRTGTGSRPGPFPTGSVTRHSRRCSSSLGVTAAGLGAAFLGNFRGEQPLLEALGVPDGWRLFGAVLIGQPDGLDHPSPSLRRPPAVGAGAIHRSHW